MRCAEQSVVQIVPSLTRLLSISGIYCLRVRGEGGLTPKLYVCLCSAVTLYSSHFAWFGSIEIVLKRFFVLSLVSFVLVPKCRYFLLKSWSYLLHHTRGPRIALWSQLWKRKIIHLQNALRHFWNFYSLFCLILACDLGWVNSQKVGQS